MKVERADRRVIVPARAESEKWTADAAQRWARELVLFGGPPEKPIDPATRATVEWSDVKKWAGRSLQIRARPMGLLIETAPGKMEYHPADASPYSMGTPSDVILKGTKLESKVRLFAKELIRSYNKEILRDLRLQSDRLAAFEFWKAGGSIRAFLKATPGVTQDRVWHALEDWGRGASGYGKNWLEYATYLYDWLPDAKSSDAVFGLSETRIMIILRASKSRAGRNRLLNAALSGPLRELGDEEFKWITGQSRTTFPLDPFAFDSLKKKGAKIGSGLELDPSDVDEMSSILRRCKEVPGKGTRPEDHMVE
ncbi:MAG: hypothetical protein ACRD6W_01000 [Nitrososphaerales archaeon]